MKRIIMVAIAVAVSVPATAANFTVQLSAERGKLLHGRGGLHAADSRSDSSLVRVISPGTSVAKRGTVRVLVMNLGQPAFEFGPSNVRLILSDGSALPKVPLKEFDEGHELVSREMRRASGIDAQVKSRLSSLAESTSSGVSPSSIGAPTPSPSAGASSANAAARQDRNADTDQLPGAKTLAAIDGVLRRDRIAPQEATGGYLVFELPKQLRAAGADERLTIVVTAGREEHRFNALLKRR